MNVVIVMVRALGNLARSHIKKMSCTHKHLGLQGWVESESLSDDTLWLRGEYLKCFDCGTRLLYIPDDVTKIVNIPHPDRGECQHEHKHYHLCGLGEWTCLNCGETGVSFPTAKLHIFSGERVGINVPDPQADLHVVGVVSRVEESLYDYGNVYSDDEEGSLVSELLRFEGKRVEITVRVL